MQIDVAGRRSGKTSRMLQWMREAPDSEQRIYVAHSMQEAMRLLRENPDLASWQFVSLGEVTRGKRIGNPFIPNNFGLGLDNLDLHLKQIYSYPVWLASLTEEE